MHNPNDDVSPDYMLPEFADARLIFTVEGKTEQQAAALLAGVWRVNHKRAVAAWDQEKAAREQAAREEKERANREAERERLAREQASELAKQRERRKYKNKFLPIPNRPLPSQSLFLPPQHALKKLRQGEYVPFYYFTNRGIREAEEDVPNLDDDIFSLVPAEGSPIFQSTTAAKAKDRKVPDEDLSWEEFGEANHHMLRAMKQEDWPEERLLMIRDFWLAIQSHKFRHGECEYAKRALLVYQARIRRQWHRAIGTPEAFALTPLNEHHLMNFKRMLRDAAVNTQIEALRQLNAQAAAVATVPAAIAYRPTHGRSASRSKRPMSPPASATTDATPFKKSRSFRAEAAMAKHGAMLSLPR